MGKRIAVITDALSATGKAISNQLAADGFSLALVAENKAEAEEFAATLNTDTYVVTGNLYTEEGAKAVFDNIENYYGKIDALVNMGEAFSPGTFLEKSADELRSSFKNNVVKMMACAQAMSSLWKKEKQPGQIVNESTDNAFTTESDRFIGSTVSWAIRGTTRAMAKSLAKYDIKVNAFCSGDSTPDEVAGLVSYLVSEKNVNMTGQNIMVNNGTYLD